MKKSTLALSVAAALGGLGFVGSASAITTVGGATATALTVNAAGIGHQLLYPYFTAQSDNATLISVVNTDTVNGKLVKVRFRGAGNSDDLYDFQLLMSPGDVWTAAVSKDAATGLAKLASSDTSCVVPANAANSTFVTGRVDSKPVKGDAINQTREGYIEMITMADVPNLAAPGLYATIKHSNGKPTCSATVLAANLMTDVADVTAALGRGLTPPSGGLTGDWVILNQMNTAAWSGSATALRATGGTGLGNLVFWPQIFGNPSQKGTPASVGTVTADPLLTTNTVDLQHYDLPDLSTPYVTTDLSSAAVRADNTSANLQITSLKHQFAAVSPFVSEVVVSQPTRRYAVALNYTTGTAVYRSGAVYNSTNTNVNGRQVCLNTVNAPSMNNLFDREETTPGTTPGQFVISPNNPTNPTVAPICGEAAVLTVNQGVTTATGALSANIAVTDITYPAAYTTGWANWDLTQANATGLPVLGGTFMRATNGAVNYGFMFKHKSTP
jgi:hypothetical protein